MQDFSTEFFYPLSQTPRVRTPFTLKWSDIAVKSDFDLTLNIDI